MKRRAQSTIEYVVLFSIVVGSLMAMQVYLKRGMQGRMQGYAEQLSQDVFYSPGATNSSSETITKSKESSSYIGKKSTSEATIEQATTRTEGTLSFKDEPRRN